MVFRPDWIGILFCGLAASLLFAGLYFLRERKDEAFIGIAIVFVICACVAYARIFTLNGFIR